MPKRLRQHLQTNHKSLTCAAIEMRQSKKRFWPERLPWHARIRVPRAASKDPPPCSVSQNSMERRVSLILRTTPINRPAVVSIFTQNSDVTSRASVRPCIRACVHASPPLPPAASQPAVFGPRPLPPRVRISKAQTAALIVWEKVYPQLDTSKIVFAVYSRLLGSGL